MLTRFQQSGLLCLILFTTQAVAQQSPAAACDDKPVYMVVAGETLDAGRMFEYAKRIRESAIYEKLGGYYMNLPRPIAVFEGDVPPNYVTLVVRFPCLENARRFWYSKVYQETIKPLRLNPSAGDYLVTVYPEGALPAYMEGAVGDAAYQRGFDATQVPQISDAP